MTDDRFEERLRQAAQDYHRPPPTPREELWRRVAAARAARQRRGVVFRPPPRWGVGIPAPPPLGLGHGRWGAPGSPTSARVAGAGERPSPLLYPVAPPHDLTR